MTIDLDTDTQFQIDKWNSKVNELAKAEHKKYIDYCLINSLNPEEWNSIIYYFIHKEQLNERIIKK